MDHRERLPIIVIAICALGFLLSLTQLYGAYAGIGRLYHEGVTPSLELVPADYNGTVVIAHGYCGDKEMMEPMGLALARNGYRVILYDSPGHGSSSLRPGDGSTDVTMAQVCDAYAGTNFSVAGHSMGSLAIRYAMNGTPEACIGISPIYGAVNETAPKNLLLLAGSADIDGVKTTSSRALANGTGLPSPAAGTTYGNFTDGTARKLVFLDGDNHISILYDARVFDDMVGWLDSTYGVSRPNGISPYGNAALWALLCIAFAIVGFVPISAKLTQVFMGQRDALRAREMGMLRPVALIMLAGLIGAGMLRITGAWPLGIQLGDTISTYLLYAGAIGLAILWVLRPGKDKALRLPYEAVLKPVVLALIFLLYFVVFIGIPTTASLYGLLPGVVRTFYIALLAAMILPYNLLSELAFRGIPAWRSLLVGATMRVVAIVLLMATALISGGGGFLIVIAPVLLPLFVALEALSYYLYKRSGNVLLGALINSLVAAWLMASAFPLA